MLVASILLVYCIGSKAQVDAIASQAVPTVVVDPVAKANALTMLGSIGNMIAGINAQIEILESAADKISKVSGFFQTLEMIDEIMYTKEMFYLESQKCMNIINAAEGTFGITFFQSTLTGVYGTTRRVESELKVIDALLTNNIISMTTSERIEYLRAIKMELQQGLSEVRAMRYRCQQSIALWYYRQLYLQNYGRNW